MAYRCDVGNVGHSATGRLANQSDTLNGHRDMPGTCNGTDMTADRKECISTHHDTMKRPNSPIKPERRPIHDQIELSWHASTPNMQDGVSECTNMAGDTQGIVSTGTAEPKPQNLPTGSIRSHSDLPDGLKRAMRTC